MQGLGSSSVPSAANIVGESLLSGEPISSSLSAVDTLWGAGSTAADVVPALADTSFVEDVGEAVSSGWNWLTSWF